MSTTTSSTTHGRTATAGTTAAFGRRVAAGAIGGVAGGIVFGMLMAMMGTLPMIAGMVGSDSPFVGFAVHLMISIMIGLGLTVLFGNLLLTTYVRGLLVGMAYGAIWWVLGPLVAMPMMFGMPPFTFDATTLPSLMGHVLYGGILGVVAVATLVRRR
ncbi:hypothetical protein [Agromyces sp. H66]|uniref:hypothetical protein n=1 Tax=Agromyces sp. H66 TaxID=2529859 RepID=UPI0020BF71A7|nr:hypothetical protein [Agromyces sp. H66]